MSQYSLIQILPFIAWFVALVEFILGVYALVLNAWHTANRHTFILLIVIALNSFAIGSMASATSVTAASPATIILAMTTTLIEPLLLVTSVALMRPTWLKGRGRWLWVLIYLAGIAPMILTMSDLWLGTRLWYTGIDPKSYTGGFLVLDQFAAGWLTKTIQTLSYALFTCISLVLLLYFSVSKNKALQNNRKFARMLLTVTLLAGLAQVYLFKFVIPGIAILVSNAAFAIVYGYACFAQMNLEHRIQRGSLQIRLTALILTVSIPLMVTITVFITSRAGKLLEAYALNNLRNSNQLLTSQLNLWLDANGKAIQAIARLPDISSMDPKRQKPALDAMASTYPYMFLISTTDLKGMNIARSDQGSMQNYYGTTWFENAVAGKPLTYVTIPINASGGPTLAVSTPIYDQSGNISGVAMFTTDLKILNKFVRANPVGRRGFAYVLNDKNQIVSSSDPTQDEVLRSYQSLLSTSGPGQVQAQQTVGVSGPATSPVSEELKTVKDLKGYKWRAYATALENNWRVIALLPESELLAYVRLFEQISWCVLALGAALLLALSWLTVKQAIQPIRVLTETATSIAAGDLTQVAPVESDDEVGMLARGFNSMTGQLRELIANLEKRVTDRTHDIERKAVQLQVTAEVASEAAAIHDQEKLLDLTVQLISQRFNFYHAGLFLIDGAGKYAVLQAASSPGGQRMLTRGHKLEVGKTGIVGFVAGTGKPRIALDVGEDAIFFNNPDLPQTRSEMALPLSIRGKVIGVLDVQSTKAAAFTNEDTSTLQILADQVALAIDNSHLIAETQQTLQELKSLYEIQVGQAWQKKLNDQKIEYVYTPMGVKPATHSNSPSSKDGKHALNVPILFRGQPLGSLVLKREDSQPDWSLEDVEVVNSIAAQIGLALENVRLLEETQRQAERERQIAEITSKLRASNDPQTIMKTATEGLQQALRAKRARVILVHEGFAIDGESTGGNGHDSTS